MDFRQALERLGNDLGPDFNPPVDADSYAQWARLTRELFHPLADPIRRAGPVITTPEAGAWLGISRQAIHKAIRSGRLVAFQVGGAWHLPVWQLRKDFGLSPQVAPIQKLLLETHPPLLAAIWWASPHPELEGDSPAQWLTAGRDLIRLAKLAQAS